MRVVSCGQQTATEITRRFEELANVLELDVSLVFTTGFHIFYLIFYAMSIAINMIFSLFQRKVFIWWRCRIFAINSCTIDAGFGVGRSARNMLLFIVSFFVF
ncbi:hypothetical protein H097_12703 [Pseudomonas sp. FH4]|nr:hypothetical protein H097_12703 [Pseudomonas sp. FH4]